MTEVSDQAIETESQPGLAPIIGYGGLIPFAVAALASWFDVSLPFGLEPTMLAKTYGAVILSFLGGIRWGVALSPLAGDVRNRHIVLSALPPIAGWCALALPDAASLTLLLAAFVAQVYWDVRAFRRGLIPAWFRDLRVALTFGAVLCLIGILPQVA